MDALISILDALRSFFTGLASGVSQNFSLDLGVKIAIGYFFVIWGAFIIWVIKDITNRTSNILIQTVSIFIVLFFTPIFGLPIYLLIRPRTTIFEQYYEEGEFQEEEEEDKEHLHHCGGCGYPVESDYHYCPKCRAELIHACRKCMKMIRVDWEVCPYCGEDNTKIEEVKEVKTEKGEKAEKKGKKVVIEEAVVEGKKDVIEDLAKIELVGDHE